MGFFQHRIPEPPVVIVTPQEVQHVRRQAIGKIALSSRDWEPWPKFEAKRLSREARALYTLHSHVTEADDTPHSELLQCIACRLGGAFGVPPMVEGWERYAVQAREAIKLRYVNRVLRLEDQFTEDYRDSLLRDVQTFGLQVLSW